MTQDDERGPADREAPPELINLVSAPDNATDHTATSPQFELDLGIDTSSAEDPLWWTHALDLIDELAESGQNFTAYDLVRRGLGEPAHFRMWGMVFRCAARSGRIECVGAVVSPRQSRAGGITRLWRGTAQFRREAA